MGLERSVPTNTQFSSSQPETNNDPPITGPSVTSTKALSTEIEACKESTKVTILTPMLAVSTFLESRQVAPDERETDTNARLIVLLALLVVAESFS